ncbi:MAG: hypothetical protein C4294_19610 [Nitrospiraceae bacterium]
MSWRPNKLTRAQMAERRQAAADLLQSGQWTQVAIAQELGVSEAAVSKWKSKLNTFGRRALEAQPGSGRPARLTPVQRRQCPTAPGRSQPPTSHASVHQ